MNASSLRNRRISSGPREIDPTVSGVVPTDRLGFTRTAHLLNIGFWTFFALLLAGRSVLVPLGSAPPYPMRNVALSVLLALVWALLTPPLFWLTTRLTIETERRALRVAQLLGIGIVVAGMVTFTVASVYTQLIPPTASRSETGLLRVWLVARRTFPNDLMIYLAIISAGTARDYWSRYQHRLAEAARLQAHTAQLQAQLAEARLAALRAQLNPHFLFNSLNAVSALVGEDPRGVRRMIARLSEMLRYALEDSGGEEVPLIEELRLLEPYLEILEIRYQGRLTTKVDVPDLLHDALVPRLLLQPLLENAMKHGIGPAGGRGQIEVRAEVRDTSLILSVEDTGSGRVAEPALSISAAVREATGSDGPGGMGLRHTRVRLHELYGTEQSFQLHPVAHGGTIAEISIPLRFSPDASLPTLSAS